MPKQNKAARAAQEEIEIRRDIDQALEVAKANDLFRFARNEEGIRSALVAILRGQAVGRGGMYLPDEKQFKNWLSSEDAVYVADYAKRKGWLKQLVPGEKQDMKPTTENKSIKLSTGQLRSMIKEALGEEHVSTLGPEATDLLEQFAMQAAEDIAGEDADSVFPDLHSALAECVDRFLSEFDRNNLG